MTVSQTSSLNSGSLFSHNSGVQVWAGLAASETLLLGLWTAVYSLCLSLPPLCVCLSKLPLLINIPVLLG